MPPIRVGTFEWSADLTTANGATSVPTAATNGVAIADSRRNERMAVLVTTTNSVNIDLYGYNGTHWGFVDTYQLTKGANEFIQFDGTGGFARLATVVTGMVGTQFGANTLVGLPEA